MLDKVMRHITTFLATGCFAGYIPVAPGTCGTVVGLGLYWSLRTLPVHVYVVTTLVFIVLAVWVASLAQQMFQSVDPPQIVIDEIAGLLVTMAFHRPDVWVALTGFILFRIFDITKPPPIRWIEGRFSDGRGVVLDDVLAGVYANAALWFLSWFREIVIS